MRTIGKMSIAAIVFAGCAGYQPPPAEVVLENLCELAKLPAPVGLTADDRRLLLAVRAACAAKEAAGDGGV